MRAILALALNDLRLLTRDKAGLFFTFGFPILVAIFFGMIFKGDGGGSALEIALVNEDGGPASQAFAADLLADESLHVLTQWGREGERQPLARAQGEEMVRKGSVVACVVLPKGFEEGAGGMFSGKSMRVEGLVDRGRAAEAGLLTGKLNELGFRQMSKVMTNPDQLLKTLGSARRDINASGLDSSQKALFGDFFTSLEKLNLGAVPATDGGGGAGGDGSGADGSGFNWKPVEVTVTELQVDQDKPANSYEISFPQGVVWGLMGCVAAFGTGMATERARGTLVRLTMAPLSKAQVIAGKALACFIACILVQLILLALATLVFQVRVREPVLMGVAILASSLGFVGVMMALAGLCRTEAAANGGGRAIILLLAMIGGGTVPLFILPRWMQTASGISPFKWTTTAIEGAVWRGFSAGDMLLPVGVLLAFGLVGFIIGTATLRWTE